MKRPLLWRGILILAITVIAVALAYPLDKKINLGLDLRGGMHLVLQVKTEDALRSETDSDMARLLDAAREEGLANLQARRVGDSSFAVSGTTADNWGALSNLAGRQFRTRENALRWDVSRRGNDVVLAMTSSATEEVRNDAVAQAVRTIDNRINAYGVAEPDIRPSGDGRIVLQLPGIEDFDRVRNLIKDTAFLEFRIVKFPRGGGGVASREEILANFGGQLPPDVEILEGESIDKTTKQVMGKVFYAVEKRRTVTGRDLSGARPGQGQYGQPVVEFTLKPGGANAFAELTGNNVDSGLAIVLDGRVVSAPVINSRISDRGSIEGTFTAEEVQDLVTVLKSGALPAGITYLEERTVGPSLGRDSVESGLKAGLIGTALVVLYMLVVYNMTGFNAVLALALNVVLLFGGLGGFNATLTLPGIAGVILTIGMAVDANVLIFERIREELRAGRTIRSAIDLGFEKALSSIVDSNMTTLIAALFLFQFGTGPIRGFAVTLTIGLLASLFTAVFVSRWMFDVVLSRFRVQRLSI